ncbi:hypothetical protein E1B28_006528 [Marasmius oreades]|uniref:Uncharacterized protein n=1 Tax=Marasmius oreades TaxID=181124 RepID=A0A9P7S8P5_9AGAR|nr:uncharacterized protein E1B28_006528 [Marasmius oreades]KAG7095833.1 hypothetical protein E1B28_006528 [Marasmius oreades]
MDNGYEPLSSDCVNATVRLEDLDFDELEQVDEQITDKGKRKAIEHDEDDYSGSLPSNDLHHWKVRERHARKELDSARLVFHGVQHHLPPQVVSSSSQDQQRNITLQPTASSSRAGDATSTSASRPHPLPIAPRGMTGSTYAHQRLGRHAMSSTILPHNTRSCAQRPPPPPHPSTSQPKARQTPEAFHNMLRDTSPATARARLLPMSQTQHDNDLSHSESSLSRDPAHDRLRTHARDRRPLTPILSDDDDGPTRKKSKHSHTSVADLTEPLYPPTSLLDKCAGVYRSEAAKVGCNRVERNTIRLEQQLEQKLLHMRGHVDDRADDLRRMTDDLQQQLHALQRSSSLPEPRTTPPPTSRLIICSTTVADAILSPLELHRRLTAHVSCRAQSTTAYARHSSAPLAEF